MPKEVYFPRYLIRQYTIKHILRRLDLKDKIGLEIGYGRGAILKILAQKGLKMYGYDMSDYAFQMANTRLKSINNISLYTNQSEIVEKNYNFLFSFEVLEHIEDDRANLQLWNKYLKADGKLILSVPAHQKKYGIIDKSAGHYRRYDDDDLKEKLKESGFEIIHFMHYGFPLSNLLEFMENYFLFKKYQNKIDSSNFNELSMTSFYSKPGIIVRVFSNHFFLFPFYLLQRFFYKTKLGSGIIVLAKKADEK